MIYNIWSGQKMYKMKIMYIINNSLVIGKKIS